MRFIVLQGVYTMSDLWLRLRALVFHKRMDRDLLVPCWSVCESQVNLVFHKRMDRDLLELDLEDELASHSSCRRARTWRPG